MILDVSDENPSALALGRSLRGIVTTLMRYVKYLMDLIMKKHFLTMLFSLPKITDWNTYRMICIMSLSKNRAQRAMKSMIP